jgi:hypothetical protein
LLGMGGKRSEEAQARRLLAGVANVRKREFLLEVRLASVKQREVLAPQVNQQATLLALEAARTAKPATKVMAAHLVDDVDEHFGELVRAAKIGARLPRTRHRPRHS